MPGINRYCSTFLSSTPHANRKKTIFITVGDETGAANLFVLKHVHAKSRWLKQLDPQRSAPALFYGTGGVDDVSDASLLMQNHRLPMRLEVV